MKPQTRFSLVAIALLFTGIAPAFAEVTTTPQTTTTTTTSTTGTSAPTTTTTSTLNKGQTDIATSLAKAQLAQYGITDPTPAQMNAALNGGTITVAGTGTGTKTVVLKGVLTQRAAGQGWGQIANGMGIKLGTAVSATKSNHHATESKEHGKHITTAGESSGEHHSHKENKHIKHGGGEVKHSSHDSHKHITTAAGSSSEHHSHKGNKHIKHGGGDVKHSSHDSHKHITTAGGTSGGVYSQQHGKHHSETVATAGGKVESGNHEHGKRYGAGIVTAGGGSYVAPSRSQPQSGQVGAGIVTANSGGSGGQGHGHSDDGAKGKSGK